MGFIFASDKQTLPAVILRTSEGSSDPENDPEYQCCVVLGQWLIPLCIYSTNVYIRYLI